MKNRILIAILALAAAAPASAQEWLVNRERFRYIGTRLTIDVVSGSPGRLQVIRGQDGWVAVASRAPQGFTVAGLSQDHRLTLTAAGEGPVDYMVAIPEGVWVNLRLPDRPQPETVGGHTRMKAFEWKERAAPATAVELPFLPPDELTAPGLFTAYSAFVAPQSIEVPELGAVRSLSVRTGGARFRISTSRPLSLQPGSLAVFEIRPAGEPMDIVIEIPLGTASFELGAGGLPALTIRDGDLHPRCGPLTRQWLSDGRQWVTFTPVEGHLDCDAPVVRRHRG